MAYNYFPTSYQQYYAPQSPIQNTQNIQQNNGIIWVQGEAGAKSYLVAPNTSVALWDSESQTIYIKSADMSGMPSIKTLDYTMRDSTTPQSKPDVQFATREEIDVLKNEINNLRSKIDSFKGKERKHND